MRSLHNHTVWSDGKLTIHELARAAASRGFAAVGASDHFETDKTECRYGREDVPAYLAECRAAEREVGIRVLAGAEIDLLAIARRRAFLDYDFPARELDTLDYVLFEYAGTKFTWSAGPHPLKRGDRGRSGDTWSDFVAYRRTLRKPVFLAHPRFDLAFVEPDAWIVGELTRLRVGIELNGGARNRFAAAGGGEKLPHWAFREEVYRAAAAAGVPFLTGCDLHGGAEELDETAAAWAYAAKRRFPVF